MEFTWHLRSYPFGVFVISQYASKWNLHGTFAPIHLKFLPLFLLFGNLFLGWLSFLRYFSESLFLLNQNNFNVTRGGHVRIDTTVSPVGPTSHFWGPVDLNVVNDQMISIQTFVLSVRFGILQHMEQEFGRLLGPTSLRCSVDLCLS